MSEENKKNNSSKKTNLKKDEKLKSKSKVKKVNKQKKVFWMIFDKKNKLKKEKELKINNNKRKNKKRKKFNGTFNVDIFDLLILVVMTAIVSCVLTGIILNYQYRNNVDLKKNEFTSNENLKNFLETYTEIADNYYEEIDEDAMIKAALEGMLGFLEDNYSIYLDKDETDSLSDMLDSSYEGIGIVAQGNVVYDVYKGSPAEKAGIKVSDEIININGTGISMDNFHDITNLLKKDEINKIIVKRNEEELTFKIEIGTINVPTTTSDVIVGKDDKKIGYISLSSFSSSSFEDFYESLLKMEKDDKINSLIIDLRGNTGGYLNTAFSISELFIKKGEIIYSLESKGKIESFKDQTNDSRNYKIVVLVNSTTASAAEILTSALHDTYGAVVVGKTTYGKGKVQTMKYYEDTMIKYTSAKWLRPNGECIDEIGIKPDYDVDIERVNNVLYDKQLDKAIEILS